MSSATGRIPRYRAWAGPPVLAAGFRAFFLLTGLFATIAVPLWLAVLSGYVSVPSRFDPVMWHAHEMLFGFVQAAVAGFLLTAVPNWTGRMPIQGWSLAVLALVFIAGRVAVAGSDLFGPAAAAAVDLAFPVLLLAALGREIIAGRNWRNLPMLAALGLLAGANGLTHLDAAGWTDTGALGLRLAIAVVVVLILLIGGRIIPSFTRNWLAKQGSSFRPTSADRFDAIALAVAVLALSLWVLAPATTALPHLMAIAAALSLTRLLRWQGLRTFSEPLVWILHVGYLWIPIGFGLIALSELSDSVSSTAAVHALTGGAAATMIVAVQTRATLGHTGRNLHAGHGTTALYLLVIASAAVRIAAGVFAELYQPLLIVAGATWFTAFAMFLALYGPMLLSPAPVRKPSS